MELNKATACDAQCETRLLEKLQKAIGDILSDHAREIATPPREAERSGNGADIGVAAIERNRAMNGHRPAVPVGSVRPNPQLRPDEREEARPAMLSRADAERIVVDTLVDLTRYPREILVPEAKFDEDLGIDSLKRVEIVTALLDRVDQSVADIEALGPLPITIGELIELTVAHVGGLPRTDSSAAQTGGKDGMTAAEEPRVDERDISLRPANVVPSFRAANFVPARAVMPDRPFDGQVALISGSGHGLGKVIARGMAALGAHVIVNSFHSRERGEQTTEEIVAAGGQATHLWGSLANSEHITRTFAEIEMRFERLDHYVHNASDGVIAPLEKITEAHWEKGFRTNIVGFHLSAMLAAKMMARTGGGRIVTLSSPGAQRYLEYFGCLGPVKAALESLTLYLARELGPYKVNVNAVSAGPIYGERLSAYPDAERLIPYWESLSADGRLGDPEEISDAVIFLLSRGSCKINGSVLLVDGAASQKM